MNESGEWLTSHLSFALSRRKQAYYRKMTKEELASILRVFCFKMVSIVSLPGTSRYIRKI